MPHAAANFKRIPKPQHRQAHQTHQVKRRTSTVESTNVRVGNGADFGGINVGSTFNGQYPGVFLTSAGLSAYNSGGVQTMFIDANSGNVAITGTGVFLGSEFLSNFGFPRTQLDNSGFIAYSSAGVPSVTISTATGDIVSTAPSSRITGGTIETSVAGTNPRVSINSSGLHAFNSAGTEIVTISTTTGILESVGGVITAGTIQTATSGSRVVFDTGGLRAYNAAGTNTVNIDTSGQLTVLSGSITLSSAVPAGTGARVVLDATGIKAYDATNTQKFVLDGTTGIIQATGIILAQPGSSLPINTLVGLLPGSANRYSNSAFQNGASTFDATGWSTDATAALSNGGTSAPPIYGALVLQATITTATLVDAYVYAPPTTDPFKRVLPGLSYTFSHYVYPTTVARNVRIDIQWLDSSGAFIGTTVGTTKTTTLNAWTRIAQTGIAIAGAAYARAVHYFALSGLNTEVYYLECFQMEEGDRVSAWAPRPDEILVNQINAVNINVANLAAISANLGTITAGNMSAVTITGSTITGSTVQTSTTDPRTVLGSTGFYAADSSGVQQIHIDAFNGIQILTGPFVYNTIEWMRSSVSSYSSTDTAAVLGVTTPNANQALVGLQANQPGGNDGADIALRASNAVNADNKVEAAAHNAAGSLLYVQTLIDGDNRSDFVRAAKQMMRVDGGVVTCTWSASSVSNTQVVACANAFQSSAICVATAVNSSLAFGIPAVFKADWRSDNPPSWNVTGFFPPNVSTTGTCSAYCVMLTW